ncbi:MAG: hypothetical protein CUN54_10535, partial [Phototrophicales bacterium]
MACAQTGSGKTAAFLIPLISKMLNDKDRATGKARRLTNAATPGCLILSPTRELAIQIHKEAMKFTYRSNLIALCCYGGSSINEQINLLSNGCDVLIGTPGRLIDLLERGRISIEFVKYLV